MYVLFDKNTSTGSVESGLGGRGMSCPLSASTRSHLSQVRGSGLSLSRVCYRSKQMTTEVLSAVFPSHKPFVHRSCPRVSCLQHRGDELWCQRAQHLLPPGCQGPELEPQDSSTIPKVFNCRAPAGTLALHPDTKHWDFIAVLTRGSALVLRLNPPHHVLH